MVNNIQKNSETKEIPVEERLRALYKLQKWFLKSTRFVL